MNPPLISGPTVSPSPQFQRRRSRLPRIVFFFAWLLALVVAIAIYLGGRGREHIDAVQAADPLSGPAGDEFLQRLETELAKTATDGAKLKQAESQITSSLPVVDQNGLQVEKRRLENAAVVIENARRDLERIREETEDLINSVKKEKHHD